MYIAAVELAVELSCICAPPCMMLGLKNECTNMVVMRRTSIALG